MMKRILAAVALASIAACSAETPPPAAKKSESPPAAPQQLAQAPAAPAPATPAAPLKKKPTKSCNTKSGKCELTITVAACTPDGITIDHNVLGIELGSRDVNIDWVIATDGYDFHKQDGVKFKGSDWNKEFDQPTGNKNKFRWRDRNNAGGPPAREYEYSITVVKTGGATCATKDPTIVNDF